jgi:hypothetical protein
MAVIAPWLKAADTLGASQAGAQVGLQQRSQNIQQTEEQQRLAQSAQQAGMQFQLEQQKLAAAQQQQSVQNMTARQEADRQYQLKVTQQAVNNAQTQQQLDLAKNAQQMKMAEFMQTLSDRHNFLDAINKGVDPKTAYMQFPNAYKAAEFRDMFSVPKAGGGGGGQMTDADKEKLKTLNQLYLESAKKAQTTDKDGKTITNSDEARAANNYKQQIDDLTAKSSPSATQPAGMAGALTQTAPQAASQTQAPGTVATPMGGAAETPPANNLAVPGATNPMNSAPADTSNPTQPNRVQVKDKNGKVFTVPQDQLNDALTQGYQQVQ